MANDVLGLGPAKDRFGFGTKRDDESVTKSIQDSFLNVLGESASNLYNKGRLNEDDLRNILNETSFNVGKSFGDYGVNLGINTPTPGRGGFTDDYSLKFSKRFQEGGEVEDDYYSTLQSVAEEKDFDLDQLTDMFIIESSGDPNAVNPLGYTGGFQFGEKTGREYGLVGDDFDYRKDLGKSAGAAIDMYRKNLRDEVKTNDGSWSLSEAYGKQGIDPNLAGYLTHQQGRAGFIDMITGAKSGKIGAKTRENMLANVGGASDAYWQEQGLDPETFSSLGNEELVGNYLGFWKDRYKTKQGEAKTWREKRNPNANLGYGYVDQEEEDDPQNLGYGYTG